MKDIKGYEVRVGDIVLCAGGCYKDLDEAVVIRTSAKTCTVSSDKRGVIKKLEGQVYIRPENTLLNLVEKDMRRWIGDPSKVVKIRHVEKWLEVLTQHLGSKSSDERYK